MIFVTVGTHEQQFNRLIQHLDGLHLEEEIFMQTGYCTYKPVHCGYSDFLSYGKMMEYVTQASIVITHGGPSSIMLPLQVGKIPIVVPRQFKYGEHVNNHQVKFAEQIGKKVGILVVHNIEEIDHFIKNYNSITSQLTTGLINNNEVFNYKLTNIVNEIM
jgi:UDP-N-acetylglucosamine transferase subunit ALG13